MSLTARTKYLIEPIILRHLYILRVLLLVGKKLSLILV